MHKKPNKHTFRSSVSFTNLKNIVNSKGTVAVSGLCKEHDKSVKRKTVHICVQCTLNHLPFPQFFYVCEDCEFVHRERMCMHED